MSKDGREGEAGREANLEDHQVEIAGLEIVLEDIEGHLYDGEVKHPDRYVMEIRIYLRREFRSMR